MKAREEKPAALNVEEMFFGLGSGDGVGFRSRLFLVRPAK
jgi:hypothetical protein